MWTTSHQLNDLSLDLMHRVALEDNRVVWQSVHTECAQKCLCYRGEQKAVSESREVCGKGATVADLSLCFV